MSRATTELPRREDAEQGALGDAGLIAILGAVAGHLPDEIARRIVAGADGSYVVTLAEAGRTGTGAVPTGREIVLRVSAELPIYDHSPGEPAYAKTANAAWAAIAEKAFAGVDAVWTARRRGEWEEVWQRLCAADTADPRIPVPRHGPAPSGYTRLNQEANDIDYAEALTQLTGRQAIVRQLPRRRGQIWRAWRRRLRAAKPVIVTTRAGTSAGAILPYLLISAHCYEVTAAGWRTATLRNPWGFAHPARVPLRRAAAVFGPWYVTLA